MIDKNGETIASAITNLDLHDIARAVRTFGARAFYVVTPLADQRELARRIVGHWKTGFGATYNPDRGDALDIVRVKDSYEAVLREVETVEAESPQTVVTSAKPLKKQVGFADLRERIQNGTPHLLNFGTAWGLSPGFVEGAEMSLPPIIGAGDYNHLSVRSAVSIILDRLLGEH